MYNDGRTTSEQLYIPSLLIVGGSQSLLLRCFHASKTMGLAIKACSPADAALIVARRHPLAIVVPNDVFAGAACDLADLARDVRSALLPVDPEVSVRELEAMIAAAIDGGFTQRERRGGMGRYSIVDGIEEEAPFSRRTLPPVSTRSPGLASTRPSLPPEAGRDSSLPAPVRAPGPVSVRPSVPPGSARSPGSASQERPSAPPATARVPSAPSVPPGSARAPGPVSVRPSVPPVSVRAPGPVSVRPSVPPSQGRASTPPTSRTLPSMPAPSAAESAPPPPPDSGVQKAAAGAFAAIRSVFSSRR